MLIYAVLKKNLFVVFCGGNCAQNQKFLSCSETSMNSIGCPMVHILLLWLLTGSVKKIMLLLNRWSNMGGSLWNLVENLTPLEEDAFWIENFGNSIFGFLSLLTQFFIFKMNWYNWNFFSNNKWCWRLLYGQEKFSTFILHGRDFELLHKFEFAFYIIYMLKFLNPFLKIFINIFQRKEFQIYIS